MCMRIWLPYMVIFGGAKKPVMSLRSKFHGSNFHDNLIMR